MPEAASQPLESPHRPAAGGATRLRAVTRRVPRRPASLAVGDEGGGGHPDEAAPEPSMRLSRALGVMLLLHVVAVGGVLAFGLIKERPVAPGTARPIKPTRGSPKPELTGVNPVADNAPTPLPPAVLATVATPGPAAAGRGVPTPPLSRAEADAVRLIESGGPNPLGPGERAYVVGRGETVQTIAQKLRVEAATLLRLNNIDDPRKIQVGQRLRVPPPGARSRS